MRNTLSLLLLILIFGQIRAADTDSLSSNFEVNLRAGYALSSNHKLTAVMPEGTPTTHSSAALHLKYSFSGLGDRRTRDVSQGLGISVATFMQPRRVGTPVGVYLFQRAPIAFLSSRFTFGYEWNFGLAAGWRKTSTLNDICSNLVSGSKVNSYINLSFPFTYTLSPDLRLLMAPEITHYSNGNTSWPNPGINTVGINLGLIYTPCGKLRLPVSPFAPDPDFTPSRGFDITLYGAWRKSYFPVNEGSFTEEGERSLLPGHFGVVGICAAPMWSLHPTFRTGPSVDIQWSENTGLQPYRIPGTYGEDTKFQRPPFLRQTSVGLSARAELVMPIFSVNIGVGYGLIGPRETRNFYQVANLKIRTSRRFFFNIGYRFIEFRSPSNLMLGLGVSL